MQRKGKDTMSGDKSETRKFPPLKSCLPAALAASVAGYLSWFVGHFPYLFFEANIDGMQPHGSFGGASFFGALRLLFLGMIFTGWFFIPLLTAFVAVGFETYAKFFRLTVLRGIFVGMILSCVITFYFQLLEGRPQPLSYIPGLISGMAVGVTYALLTNHLRPKPI